MEYQECLSLVRKGKIGKLGGQGAVGACAVGVGMDSKEEGRALEPGREELMGKGVRESGVPLSARVDGEG